MVKKITIKDIAELAKTSKTTVSFYLSGQYHKMSEETRYRIEKVIKETNYQPSAAARILNSKKSNLIGVIIGDVTNEFSNQLIKGIDMEMSDQNYQMILGNSSYDPKKEKALFERMIKMGIDGFIIQPTMQFQTMHHKLGSDKPIVFIDSQVSISKDKWVKSNNYEAVLDTMEKMIANGYEEFLMFTAEPNVLSTRMERTQGFFDALKLANKVYDYYIVDQDVTSQQISDYVSQTLKLNKKTLIFVPNCWLLPIVYKGLLEFRNLIPNTVGIVGFDNVEWTNFAYPTVTTIVQPAMEEGKAACRILIDEIEEKELEAPNQILKCTLNEKESTNLQK